jgi:hypothetical protein
MPAHSGLQLIEIEIGYRSDVKGHYLGKDQPSDNGKSQRSSGFSARTEADCPFIIEPYKIPVIFDTIDDLAQVRERHGRTIAMGHAIILSPSLFPTVPQILHCLRCAVFA